jgi:spore germination protein PC
VYSPPHPLQDLYARLYNHETRIRELEKMVAQLQAEVATLRQQRSIHVERIEYKFDQLKVDRLEGTLTIGISPADQKSSIENLVIDDKEMEPAVTKASEAYQQIFDCVDAFVNNTGPSLIQRLESEHQVIVGAKYREMMLDDIRKQIGKRIRYYIDSNAFAEESDIVQAISSKIESDVRYGIEQHFTTVLKKEEPPS